MTKHVNQGRLSAHITVTALAAAVIAMPVFAVQGPGGHLGDGGDKPGGGLGGLLGGLGLGTGTGTKNNTGTGTGTGGSTGQGSGTGTGTGTGQGTGTGLDGTGSGTGTGTDIINQVVPPKPGGSDIEGKAVSQIYQGAMPPGGGPRSPMPPLPKPSAGAPDDDPRLEDGPGVAPLISDVSSRGGPEEQANGLVRSAQTKMAMKDYPGAIDDASKAIAFAPSDAKAYNVRAAARNLTGRYAEAEADARQALQFYPKNSAAYENLAWSQLRQKKYRDSADSATKARELNKDSAMAHATRAYARQMLGDRDGMLADMEAAAFRDERFKDQLLAAKSHGRVYDPDADDASYLLGAALAAAARSSSWPAAALAAFAAAGAGLGLVLRRRSSTKAGAVTGKAGAPEGLLGGKYKLGSVIGKGGMGEVCGATDVSLGRAVAVKRLARTLSTDPKWRDYFLKEARTVASLHHPAIVDIYEIVEQGDDLYLVFEFVRGKTVQHIIAERGRIPPSQAAGILRPVCEALEFAHGRNMVHRDLKPANVMITEQGHIKLMDFGIARAVSDQPPPQGEAPGAPGERAAGFQFDRTATVIGTPSYMAPEAADGVVSRQGDVYSLGVCLYEMLTARLPFPPPADLAAKVAMRFTRPSGMAPPPALPKAIDELVDAALQPDPRRRLQTAREFLERLEAAVK